MNTLNNILPHSVKENELQKQKFKEWMVVSNCWWYKYHLGMAIDMFPARAEKQKSCLSVCVRCPTQYECLELALTLREENGVWGGTTEAERKDMLDEIAELHSDLPKTIWTAELGQTISEMAKEHTKNWYEANHFTEEERQKLIAERREPLTFEGT